MNWIDRIVMAVLVGFAFSVLILFREGEERIKRLEEHVRCEQTCYAQADDDDAGVP